MSQSGDRLRILKVWVDTVDMGQALQKVREYIENDRRPHVIYAVNPEKSVSVPQDPALHQAFREADLLIPDGIGIVMAARILYGVNLSRVPGVELSGRICALAAEKGYRIFIYGAKEAVNKKAVETLWQRYPKINIVGRANGYLPEEQMEDLVSQINRSNADILFVALGSPKQEMWIAKHSDSLKTVRVCQGIGGTLDTIAGNVKRAPEIWCRFGLEWLYRLISNPRRINRQKKLPVFAAQVVLWKFGALFKFSDS